MHSVHPNARTTPAVRAEIARSSEPTGVLARRYGVSDVAIAKACALLAIPKPPRGYWAKRAAGQKLPNRPPLLNRES